MEEAFVIYLAVVAAIAATARIARGRSAMLWFLGAGAAVMFGQMPLRFAVLQTDPSLFLNPVGMAIAECLLIGGILLMILFGLPDRRNVVQTPPATAETRTCPHCAEDIKAAAKVCKHCGRDVKPDDVRPLATAD